MAEICRRGAPAATSAPRRSVMMMLSVQPVRVAPVRAAASRSAPRRAATCSLRERAGASLSAAALAATLLACPPAFAKAADFGVYWLSPDDGATVSSPVAAKFGVKGLDVKPAGARPDLLLTWHGCPLAVHARTHANPGCLRPNPAGKAAQAQRCVSAVCAFWRLPDARAAQPRGCRRAPGTTTWLWTATS
jgi:hypothetical protein